MSGTATAARVNSGGVDDVSAGGNARNAIINSGGVQSVGFGGLADDTTVSNGGIQTVSGIATHALVESGGLLETETLPGSFFGAAVSLCLASAATILHGGTIRVGGVAIFTTLDGAMDIIDHGAARPTSILSGGSEIVSSGGIDQQSIIASGGMAFILSGGMVRSDTVESGGTLTVSSGAHLTDGLTIEGGTALISGIANGMGAVTFVGSSGNLTLDNVPNFAEPISGFGSGDAIDLGGFAYGSAVTSSYTDSRFPAFGTLTIVDGGQQAALALLGTYVTSNFALSDDHAGGTLVKFS